MKKELLKPLTNAIFALLLIVLIQIVAAVMLKLVKDADFYLETCLRHYLSKKPSQTLTPNRSNG